MTNHLSNTAIAETLSNYRPGFVGPRPANPVGRAPQTDPGFSGVISENTGNWIMRPSNKTVTQDGLTNAGRGPRNTFHRTLQGILQMNESAVEGNNFYGFTAFKTGPNRVRLEFRSGLQRHLPNNEAPPNVRAQIVEALRAKGIEVEN